MLPNLDETALGCQLEQKLDYTCFTEIIYHRYGKPIEA
jgi:hypothetical protein